MKHTILLILLTFGVLAQEVGVPYVKGVSNGISFKGMFYSNDKKVYYLQAVDGRVFSFDPILEKIAFYSEAKTSINPFKDKEELLTINENIITVWDNNFEMIRGKFCQGGFRHGIKNIVSMNNTYIYLYDNEEEDSVYNIDEHKKIFNIKNPDNRPSTEVIFISEALMMTSTMGGNIYLWDVTEKKIIKSLHVSDGPIVYAKLIPKTAKLLIVHDKNKFTILDEQFNSIQTITIPKVSSIQDFNFTPNSQNILVDTPEKQYLINIKNGIILDTYEHRFCSKQSKKSIVCTDKKLNSISLTDLTKPNIKLFIPRLTENITGNIVRDVEIFKKNNLLFIFAGGYPSIELWDYKHLKKLMDIYVLNDESWIAINLDGYFKGSLDIRKYLYMKTSSGESVPIDDVTYQKHHKQISIVQ